MIFDEIHGFIKVNDVERAIIDTPIFQRLRHIAQTGLAYYVYPGATHTRLSHSIGVLHLAGRVGSNLLNEGYLTSDELQLLRLAALLHDIGHYPLSHSLELCLFRLYGESACHENLTLEVLRKSIIADKLKDYGYTPNEIISILKGECKNNLLTQIISSDTDIDKMDYLLRDSKHTGVAYGVIDVERLVNTLSVDANGDLALLEKGLGALENLYLARLQMYKTVYYHKTIVSFELMLGEIYRELVERGEIMILNEVYSKVSSEEFVFFNDHYIFNKLYNIILNEKNYPKSIVNYAKMFIARRPLKILFDFSVYFFDKMPLPLGEDFISLKEIENTIPFEAEILFVKKPIKIIIDGSKGESVPATSDRIQTIIRYIPRGLIIKRLYAKIA